MTPLISDVRLARQAGDGDRRAFEAIFKRYHQDLYRFCLSIVGRPEDAQDALQNTMVKTLRALPGERRDIRLKPWLYRVAHNESVDLLRRRREGPELDAERASGGEITETVAQRERLGRLLADLGELPERQRSALVMRELGGLDYEQIGAAFESSPEVARQTVYEARLGLRELETGREMHCDAVTRLLSEADGRIRRRRDVRAHLRACGDCRAFRDSIDARGRDLAALAPLPAAAAASILHGVVGGNVAAGGGGIGGAVGAAGAGAGKAAGTSVAVKAVATVAIAATVGVTAADRGGLIDLGLPGKQKGESSKSAPASGASGASAGPASGAEAGTARKGPGASAGHAEAGLSPAAQAAGPAPAAGGASPASTNAPAASPAQSGSRGNGGGQTGGGQAGQKPEASQHGQETSADHKATGKGGSKSRGAHPSHPSHPANAKGGQGSGKAKGASQASQPAQGEPAPTQSTHAEPPGQAKSEAPSEPQAAQEKDLTAESEPSS